MFEETGRFKQLQKSSRPIYAIGKPRLNSTAKGRCTLGAGKRVKVPGFWWIVS